ncbi:MAG TPA: hypothetical protein VN577_02855 [Terriglobales bacterium]|nr:hypothetical protein [Terriglobales bacterium]
MRRLVSAICLAVLGSGLAFGAALGTSTRNAIPSDVQQIISVDYRALRNSPTALALKGQVLPQNLKDFEAALRGVGVNPDMDVEQLTFASFRVPKGGLKIIGVAAGQFPTKKLLARMRAKKITGTKYRTNVLYPMNGGVQMSFLDDYTMLFGEQSAIKAALDARDGESESLNSNGEIGDLIQSVDNGAVWSVLDTLGTQNLLRSTLGDASKLADYESVKKRVRGSRYTMDFNQGVNFNLDVVTSDAMTAATLSSVLKAGILFRKMNAEPAEKMALESTTVDSDSGVLKLRFKTDDSKFQALMKSDLFQAVSR